MGTLESPNLPKQVQFVTTAWPTIRRQADNKPIGPATTRPGKPHHKDLYLFLAALTTPKNGSERFEEVTVSLSKSLEFPTDSNSITFTAKLTYKLRVTLEILCPPCIPPAASSILKLVPVSFVRR